MFQILLWSPWKGKKECVPLRTAYSQNGRCGMQPKAKPSSLRAQAQLSESRTETEKTSRLKEIREEKGERERCASRRYLLHIIVKLIC
ncbi:hypothetical protein TNCV_4933311 [Trichonephila clavipes]|nr:hypothetical protein TNCV_4933311 [Trichonephila clavipes]